MAAAAMSRFCPNCPPDDVCAELRRQIRQKIFQKYADTGVRGLVERLVQQNAGGQAGFAGHDQAINQVRTEIKERQLDFKRNQCGDKAPLGADAKKAMNSENPTRDDLADQSGRAEAEEEERNKANPVQANSEQSGFMGALGKATGLTGTALLGYAIISEGSRLFPPRNLVPVP